MDLKSFGSDLNRQHSGERYYIYKLIPLVVHHRAKKIYYATLLHGGCLAAWFDRSLRLSGRFDSCTWCFDSKPSISSPSKGRLAKPFDNAKLFEALRTAQ